MTFGKFLKGLFTKNIVLKLIALALSLVTVIIVNAQPTAQDESAFLRFRDLEQFSRALDNHLDRL